MRYWLPGAFFLATPLPGFCVLAEDVAVVIKSVYATSRAGDVAAKKSLYFCATLIFLFFFFASPKKKQKRSPEIEYSPISGSSYVGLLYYCSIGIGNSTLRMQQHKFLLKLLFFKFWFVGRNHSWAPVVITPAGGSHGCLQLACVCYTLHQHRRTKPTVGGSFVLLRFVNPLLNIVWRSYLFNVLNKNRNFGCVVCIWLKSDIS